MATASNSDVNSAVASAMSSYGLSASGYTVSITPGDVSGAAEGSQITVTVQCTWGTVGIRPLQLMSANKTVVGTAVMRKEG